MIKRKRSLMWPIAIVLMLGFVAAGLLLMWRSQSAFVPPALPEPNGYDDLLRAAEMVHRRTGFYDEMDSEELAEVVVHNRPALELARDALDKPIGVPVDWSRNPAANGVDPALLDQAQAMRSLARAFVAEMRELSSNGKTQEAAEAAFTTYELGAKCNHGGLIVGQLVGIAIQNYPTHELGKLVVQEPSARADVLKQLPKLIEEREPMDAVIKREVDYIESASRGWIGLVIGRQLGSMMEPAIKAARQAELRSLATQRLLLTHIAIHEYRDQHGSWPDNLEDLESTLSPTLIVDPFGNGPLVYRVEGESYRLYSVGIDGVDDAGEGDETGLQRDLVFDLPVEEDE